MPERRFASALELFEELQRLTEIGVSWTDADTHDWWTNHGDALVLAVRADTTTPVSQPLTVGGR